MRQRQASGHTIAAYRDSAQLLLGFASDRTGKPPSQLDFADLDAPLIAAFLDDLQHRRGNSTRTRNARLAAIHSLFRYAGLHHPEHAADIARVLAIPPRREHHTDITFLTDTETTALLHAPDRATWTGRRDHTLLHLTVQTGLHASELTSATHADLHLGAGPHITCHGKGRKDRVTPLTTSTVTILRAWTAEGAQVPTDPLFPTRRGPTSQDALAHRIARHATHTARRCPTLAAKNVTRTSCATPQQCACYTPASTSPSSRYGSATRPPPPPRSTCTPTRPQTTSPGPNHPHHGRPGRYQPPDHLLAFLQAL